MIRSARKFAVFAALLIASSSLWATISFDFISLPGSPGATISFDGPSRTFSFPDSSFDFVITNASDPSLNGLQGKIAGTFGIGNITTNGGLQTAPVTGEGTFSISDGNSELVASLQWLSAFSFGSTVGLNSESLVNLSSFSYSGDNAALKSISSGFDGKVTLTTQFIPSLPLDKLATGTLANSSSYSGSGSVTPIPEPSVYAMLGAGLIVVGAVVRRQRKGL